jgi:hypothetical protein
VIDRGCRHVVYLALVSSRQGIGGI